MMLIRPTIMGATLAAGLLTAGIIHGAETAPYACSGPVDDAFLVGVWAKVAAQDCLKCHKDGGDAEDSDFVLRDPTKALGAAREEMMRHNHAAFTQMARRSRKVNRCCCSKPPARSSTVASRCSSRIPRAIACCRIL